METQQAIELVAVLKEIKMELVRIREELRVIAQKR